MKDFNRKKEAGMGNISKKKKNQQIIFRTGHLVVDDGERTARITMWNYFSSSEAWRQITSLPLHRKFWTD